MQDGKKTKSQLVQEIQTLRKQVNALLTNQVKLKSSHKSRSEHDGILHLLFKCSDDMIFISQLTKDGSPGRFIEVNNVACEKLGYRREELLKLSPFDISAPELQDPIRDHSHQFHAKRKILYETEYVRKNSSRIPVEINARMFKYRGTPLVFAIVRDISERKQAESALKESEEKYRSLVEFHQCPIYLINKDLNYLFANKMYRKRIGLQKSNDIIGKAYSDYHSPQNTRSFKMKVNELFRSCKPLHYEYQSDRDGKYFLRTLSPVKDPISKTISAATVISIDITDLKHAEKALRQSEEKYRCFVDRANDGIAIVQEGRVVYANQQIAEMLHYSLDDVVNQSVTKFVPRQKQTWLLNRYQKRLSGDHVPSIYETELRRGDGKNIPVEVNAGLIPYDGGMADMIIIRDIAERKKVEEQIRTSLREKEVLLQEVHHRVKNNFQVIISLLNLQAGQMKDKLVQQACREHNHRIRSMALVHEKLYRSENFSTIQFNDYVDDMIRELMRVYRISEKTKIQLEIDDSALHISVAVPCGLILNELVSNALKYAFPENKKGKIQISFHLRKDHKYELIVQDNGVGLSSDIDFKNTNSMGLYLVKLLTKQIEGTVRLSRKEGTTFKILFPKETK